MSLTSVGALMGVIRQVVKGLVRRPWYTTAIVLVLAVGCALVTTVFAVVDGVLFKPLGYPGEAQLVAVKVASSRSRSLPRVLPEDVAAWSRFAPGVLFTGFHINSTDGTSVGLATVQSSFFDVIGVRPAVGGFAPEDFERRGSTIEPRVITDEIFRVQFGGDPAALGRVVIVDPSVGSGYRIVGIMPRGFVFPTNRLTVGYLRPLTPDYPGGLTYLIAKLTPGISATQLQQRVMTAAAARNAVASATASPATEPIDRVDVERLGRALGAASRPLFTALLVAAAVLVAIAALNVSSLVAARSIDRGRDLDVRRALGATTLDIGRLLVVEAALLVTAGAMFGLTIAVPLLRFTATLLPADLALFRAAAVDWRAIAFLAIVAAVLGMLIAVRPLRLAKAGKASFGPTRTATFQVRPWSQRLVVVFQVALALVLTVAGSLLVASLLSVYVQIPPITTRDTLTVAVNLLGQGSAWNGLAPERATRANALVERLRAIPGVEGVAVTAYDLLERAYVRSWFKPPAGALNVRQPMLTQAVTADFYRIVQPELVSGRFPSARELATDEPVIVVSQSVASNYWPDASPLGETLMDQGPRGEPERMFTVLGVVKDIRWHAWDVAPMPMIYGPYALLARQAGSVVVIRTPGEKASITTAVLRAIAEVDPFARIGRVAPLRDLFVDSVRQRRFQAWIFGSFAAASLCVVVIGIFGQLTMTTARRTREVGIRITCGATRGTIVRLILTEQLVPVIAGMVVGGIGAAWSVRFVRSYLYQVAAFDARVWIAAIALILVMAVAGILVPALRASSIDPSQALRAE